MARQVTTERTEVQDDRIDRAPALERDTTVAKDIRLNQWQRLIYTITGIINGLLAIRFIFSLLGANPNNGLADHDLVLNKLVTFAIYHTIYQMSIAQH